MTTYYKDSTNRIYKVHKGGYLILSPIEKWEVRFVKELPEKCQLIGKNKVDQILAGQWKPIKQTWTYRGEKFMVRKNFSKNRDENPSVPIHTFIFDYIVAFYRGRLVWVACDSSHYKGFQTYAFNGIDKQPGCRIGWVQLTNLKPVYNKTQKRYI